VIRVSDPGRLGPALRDVRNLLGINRMELGRLVEGITGRPAISVVHQVQQWDDGTHAPTVSSLGPVLEALGYDLALVPREEA
jgi:hypothetical protein